MRADLLTERRERRRRAILAAAELRECGYVDCEPDPDDPGPDEDEQVAA